MSSATKAITDAGRIELQLNDLAQLFNSMDPSPFHERDLDRDAEEFIVSWAREHPRSQPLRLVIHLAGPAAPTEAEQQMVRSSIQHYFEYRAGIRWRDFKQLMRQGRASLLIGVGFLLACQFTATLLPAGPEAWRAALHDGLTITGWVAMWRPIEIYLYRWWPLLAERRLLLRLAFMPVEFR